MTYPATQPAHSDWQNNVCLSGVLNHYMTTGRALEWLAAAEVGWEVWYLELQSTCPVHGDLGLSAEWGIGVDYDQVVFDAARFFPDACTADGCHKMPKVTVTDCMETISEHQVRAVAPLVRTVLAMSTTPPWPSQG